MLQQDRPAVRSTHAQAAGGRSPHRGLLLIAALALAGVASALVSQYAFDMQPCPWCILQRLIFVVLGLVALGAAFARAWLRRWLAGAVLLLSALGAAAAVYQNLVASKSVSCNLTLADRVLNALGVETLAPWLFQIRASCADAAVSLLGVPYEMWSLALFVVTGLLSVRSIIRPR
jgi:protein dithiol:quinone oxidoreductase